MRRLWALAVALCAVMAVGRTASAAPRVAVLRVEYDGRVPEVSKVRLSEQLVSGLANAGFEVAAGTVLKNVLESGPAPESCKSETCYRQIAERGAFEYLVIAAIGIKEKNYDLKLELVSGRDGKPAGEPVRERCELCGIQEVGDKLDKLASSLTAYVDARRAAAPARLTIHSEPAGASVTVDGRAAGETPISVELSPGAHELALMAAGHAGARKKITLESGIRGLVSVDLIPLSSGGQLLPVQGSPLRAVGWTALGVGLAAIAGGLYALSRDHDKVDCPDSARMAGYTECFRNTKLLVGALLGAGGVTAAVGGLVLVFGQPAPSTAPAEAVLSSVSLGFRRRF
jgi:hypothetical protein